MRHIVALGSSLGAGVLIGLALKHGGVWWAALFVYWIASAAWWTITADRAATLWRASDLSRWKTVLTIAFVALAWPIPYGMGFPDNYTKASEDA